MVRAANDVGTSRSAGSWQGVVYIVGACSRCFERMSTRVTGFVYITRSTTNATCAHRILSGFLHHSQRASNNFPEILRNSVRMRPRPRKRPGYEATLDSPWRVAREAKYPIYRYPRL